MLASFVSTFIISSNFKRLKIINGDLQTNLNDCEYINNQYLEKYAQSLFSEDRVVRNVYVSNNNFDSILLRDLIDSTKLIYRFYKESCIQCVEDELDIVKQLGDSIGANNILIVCDFDKINNIAAMITRKKIKSPYFIYQEKFALPIENDELYIPAFFLLDRKLCQCRIDCSDKRSESQNRSDRCCRRWHCASSDRDVLRE